jgi:hypothetical protein
MSKLRFKSLWIAALIGGAIAISYAPLASASVISYSLTTNDCSSGCGSGPFGTVTVSSLSTTEVSVDVTLASGNVFTGTNAGYALLFDITGNPLISVSGLTSGFTATNTAGSGGNALHADGTGYWEYAIGCTGCGNGASPPNLSGPINFDITVAGGITPASFINGSSKNGGSSITDPNGLFFATHIGVPDGMGGFGTGDVGAPVGVTAVPLPAAAWLLLSGLAGMGAMARRRLTAA